MSAISSAYNYASTGLSNYVRNIPSNTPTEAIKSFGISFTVATILSANPVHGAICGTLAATATLVQALVSPFFDQTRPLTDFEALFRNCIAFTGAAALGFAAFGTAAKVKTLIGFAFLNMVIRYFYDGQDSPRKANSFIYF